MPTPRVMLGAAGLNGILYTAGGQDSGANALNAFEAYDPVTQRTAGTTA